MAYKIWIWIDRSGIPRTGAGSFGWQEDAIDREQVYGSQLKYRCVAETPRGPRIMTRTRALRDGYRITWTAPFATRCA